MGNLSVQKQSLHTGFKKNILQKKDESSNSNLNL